MAGIWLRAVRPSTVRLEAFCLPRKVAVEHRTSGPSPGPAAAEVDKVDTTSASESLRKRRLREIEEAGARKGKCRIGFLRHGWSLVGQRNRAGAECPLPTHSCH